MINDNLKLIFVHIPKTGGTSIKKSLGITNRSLGYHKRANDIKKEIPDKWKNYFKFSVVRNPYDRVYSIYSYYKMGFKITSFDEKKMPNLFSKSLKQFWMTFFFIFIY